MIDYGDYDFEDDYFCNLYDNYVNGNKKDVLETIKEYNSDDKREFVQWAKNSLDTDSLIELLSFIYIA